MSKIYNHYENDLDRAWYNSSNVLYSECDDIDGGLKQVRVTFSSGKTYWYKNVDVNDYLLFREDVSQGKALSKFIKKYECERLEDKNVDDIINALNECQNQKESLSADELISQMEDIKVLIRDMQMKFQKVTLTDGEMAYLMKINNDIIESLTITKFTDSAINFLNLMQLWENNYLQYSEDLKDGRVTIDEVYKKIRKELVR